MGVGLAFQIAPRSCLLLLAETHSPPLWRITVAVRLGSLSPELYQALGVIPPSAGKLSSPTCLFASQPRCESRRIHRSEFLHLHILVLLERRGGYACFFICRHNPDL